MFTSGHNWLFHLNLRKLCAGHCHDQEEEIPRERWTGGSSANDGRLRSCQSVGRNSRQFPDRPSWKQSIQCRDRTSGERSIPLWKDPKRDGVQLPAPRRRHRSTGAGHGPSGVASCGKSMEGATHSARTGKTDCSHDRRGVEILSDHAEGGCSSHHDMGTTCQMPGADTAKMN